MVFVTNNLGSKVNPLSKIVITSMKAVVYKDVRDAGRGVVASYQDDVKVTLVDGSEMHSDKLDIIIKHNKKPQGESVAVKQVKMSGHVRIKREALFAKADHVVFTLPEQDCFLQGRVHITRSKLKETDVPLDISGEKGMINLQTLDATLFGTIEDPVRTTIELEGYSAFQKKLKKECKS